MTEQDYKRHIDAYSDDLLRYLAKNLQDLDDAKDILQDTFIALWEQKTKVENSKTKNWLFVTAHNRMLKLIRHKKVVRKTSEDEVAAVKSEPSIKQNTEDVQQIDYLLSQLNELQKQCITLKEWSGFSVKEIAQIMNISEQNVKINLFRAKIKLREIAVKDKK